MIMLKMEKWESIVNETIKHFLIIIKYLMIITKL